jgi:hypothetical protein
MHRNQAAGGGRGRMPEAFANAERGAGGGAPVAASRPSQDFETSRPHAAECPRRRMFV